MISYRQALAANTATPAVTETDPVHLMADAMLELSFNGRVVDRDALLLKGFTAAEIDRHGGEARDLATARTRGQAA